MKLYLIWCFPVHIECSNKQCRISAAYNKDSKKLERLSSLPSPHIKTGNNFFSKMKWYCEKSQRVITRNNVQQLKQGHNLTFILWGQASVLLTTNFFKQIIGSIFLLLNNYSINWQLPQMSTNVQFFFFIYPFLYTAAFWSHRAAIRQFTWWPFISPRSQKNVKFRFKSFQNLSQSEEQVGNLWKTVDALWTLLQTSLEKNNQLCGRDGNLTITHHFSRTISKLETLTVVSFWQWL